MMRALIALLLVALIAPTAHAASWFGLRDHDHTAAGQGGSSVNPALLGALNDGYYIGEGGAFFFDNCTWGTDCVHQLDLSESIAAPLFRLLTSDLLGYSEIKNFQHGNPLRITGENASGTNTVMIECDPDLATVVNNTGQCVANDGDEYFLTGNSQSLTADHAITNNDTTYETVVQAAAPAGLYRYEFFGMFTANNATPGMDLSVNSTGGSVDFEYSRLECIDNTTGVVHLETYANAIVELALPNDPDTYCHGLGTVEVTIDSTIRLQMRQALTSANAIQAQEGVTLILTRVGE